MEANEKWLISKLHDEVNMGHLEIVRQLLEQGADVNGKDPLGSTPLMAAAYTGQANLVRLLLEFGADTTARDLFGKTAQELAQELAQDLTRGLLHQEVLLAFAEHGAA